MPSSSSSLPADLGLKDLTLKDGEAVCQEGFMLLEEGEVSQPGTWNPPSPCTRAGWGPDLLVLGARCQNPSILYFGEYRNGFFLKVSPFRQHSSTLSRLYNFSPGFPGQCCDILAQGFCCPFPADCLKLDPLALLLFGISVWKMLALDLLLILSFFYGAGRNLRVLKNKISYHKISRHIQI